MLTPERKAVLTFLKKLFKDFQMCVVRVLVSYLFSLVDCSRAGTNSLDKVSQSDVQEMTGRLITVFPFAQFTQEEVLEGFSCCMSQALNCCFFV